MSVAAGGRFRFPTSKCSLRCCLPPCCLPASLPSHPCSHFPNFPSLVIPPGQRGWFTVSCGNAKKQQHKTTQTWSGTANKTAVGGADGRNTSLSPQPLLLVTPLQAGPMRRPADSMSFSTGDEGRSVIYDPVGALRPLLGAQAHPISHRTAGKTTQQNACTEAGHPSNGVFRCDLQWRPSLSDC